jgi:hypothetical protein
MAMAIHEMDDFSDDTTELLVVDEDLHPDLVESVTWCSGGGLVIRHSLCHNYFPNVADANRFYVAVKHRADRAWAMRDWQTYVFLHSRPDRFEVFKELAEELEGSVELENKEYWELLRSIWEDAETTWRYHYELPDLLGSTRPDREYMMDDEERKALSQLPEEITIYRGYHRRSRRLGWSWTTDEAKARWFATRLWQNGRHRPRVAVGRCRKEDVVAYLLGRKESEIVIDPDAITWLRVQGVD